MMPTFTLLPSHTALAKLSNLKLPRQDACLPLNPCIIDLFNFTNVYTA